MVFLVNVLVNGSMVEQFVSVVKDKIVAKHTKHQGHKSVKGGGNVTYIRIGLILPVFEMNQRGRNGQGLIKKNCQNHLLSHRKYHNFFFYAAMHFERSGGEAAAASLGGKKTCLSQSSLSLFSLQASEFRVLNSMSLRLYMTA